MTVEHVGDVVTRDPEVPIRCQVDEDGADQPQREQGHHRDEQEEGDGEGALPPRPVAQHDEQGPAQAHQDHPRRDDGPLVRVAHVREFAHALHDGPVVHARQGDVLEDVARLDDDVGGEPGAGAARHLAPHLVLLVHGGAEPRERAGAHVERLDHAHAGDVLHHHRVHVLQGLRGPRHDALHGSEQAGEHREGDDGRDERDQGQRDVGG